MKDIDEIICGCGGKPEEVKTTSEEDEKHGCYRKGCCVRAWQCPSCAMRWLIKYQSPDPDWS